MKAWQQFFGTTGTVGTWLGRGGGEGGATLQAPKRAGPASSLKHAVCLAQLTQWPAETTVSPCPVQSLHAVAKWSKKKGLQKLLPNMWLRDMVKRGCDFNAKNVITATMWNSCLLRKNMDCVLLFFLLCLPSDKRSPFGKPHFHHPGFLHTMQNANSGTTLVPHVVTS